MHPSYLVVAALLLAGSADLVAQESATESIKLAGDAIELGRVGSTDRFSFATVHPIEVSQGRRSRWLVGAGIGLVVGAGVTYVILHSGGSTAPCDRSANQDAMSSTECLGLTALGGLAGAGLGAIVGGLFHSEPKTQASLERLRLSWLPQPGRPVGARITLAF